MSFWANTKRRLHNKLLNYLLNAITIDEIVTQDPKTKAILIDGNPVQDNEVRQLNAEIKALEGFRIWTLLSHTTKSKAEERIFKLAITTDDIHFGKAMLYNLSLQHSIIEAIKSKKL
jgi:hypothetical protein